MKAGWSFNYVVVAFSVNKSNQHSYTLLFCCRLSCAGWPAALHFHAHIPTCQLPAPEHGPGIFPEGSQPRLHEELQPHVPHRILLHLSGPRFAFGQRQLWPLVCSAVHSFRPTTDSRDIPCLLFVHIQLEGANFYHEYQDLPG